MDGRASDEMQIFCGLWLFCSAEWFVHWLRSFPLGIRLGLFPLWLRAPRFLGAACSSLCLLWQAARGGSCLGRGRSSSPQLGLLLVPSESALAQPLSSFSLVRSWCRFRFEPARLRLGSALVL